MARIFKTAANKLTLNFALATLTAFSVTLAIFQLVSSYRPSDTVQNHCPHKRYVNSEINQTQLNEQQANQKALKEKVEQLNAEMEKLRKEKKLGDDIVDLETLKNEYEKTLEELKKRDTEVNSLLRQHIEKQKLTNQQPEKATPESTSEEEFQRRAKRVNDVCGKRQVPGGINRVYMDQPDKVIYCMVPKAGCTFWKRIFHAVKEHPGATKEQVFNMSRLQVHNRPSNGVFSGYKEQVHNTDAYPTRLLVTRDPYSRLLSTWLDKAYLPDFWTTEMQLMAPKITKMRNKVPDDSNDFLRQHMNSIANTPQYQIGPVQKRDAPLGSNVTSTQFSVRCGKFVTFAQFVSEGIARAEPHWMPIHTICNPCKFHPTHVSAIETYTPDARPVLAKMGMEHVLDGVDDDQQVDIELSMIVTYNFNHLHRFRDSQDLKSCVTNRELAFRLYQNFQWRGYIDPDTKYIIPLTDEEMPVRTDLMQQIWRARESGLRDPGRMRQAKKAFKNAAYKSLGKDLFERVTSRYQTDFELFGYEKKRDEIRAMFS